MDCRLLVRPEVKVKKTETAKEKVIPADLAAAYGCYHVNVAERRKLEEKLQIIDIETKQMKRNFRRQKEALEKEMKKTESDYWNCHRVFSAATLITESDSYRKRFYSGPQPTKAKLPRRTLDRLSQLVRSLQAEDDLEILSRFQRCARYVNRKVPEFHHDLVSSLTLSHEGGGEFNPREKDYITEMLNERSTDKAGRLSCKTSIKEKRIRSAPPRVTSRPVVPECTERRHSTSPKQYSPKKLELGISQISSSKAEESKRISHAGGKEKASIKFAWTEKEKPDTTVADAIDTSNATVEGVSPDIDLMQTSLEHETSHSSISSHQDPLRGESNFVHVQSKEATISEPDYRNSTFSTICQGQAYLESPTVENQRREDENLEFDSISAKGPTTRNNRWNLIRVAYLENKKSSASSSCDILKKEDFAHILEKRGKGRDVNPPESIGECSFMEHAVCQSSDNEAQHLMQRKKGDKGADVTDNNTYGAALYSNEGPRTKGGRKISVALPKGNLHGFSTVRKSLTARDQHKLRQRHHRASIKAEDKHELGNTFAHLQAKTMMFPNDADKRPDKEKQAHKKKRVSIFKRPYLTDALVSGQTQVESELRHRVQDFLGGIHNVNETSEEETGEE